MWNFRFQMGLAYLRLRDRSTALQHLNKAAQDPVRKPHFWRRFCREGDGRETFSSLDIRARENGRFSREGEGEGANNKRTSSGVGDEEHGESDVVANDGFEASLHYHRWA